MASDSLVIGDLIETLGPAGGTPSTIPELVNAAGIGATFKLLAPDSSNSQALGYGTSYDLGTPQPTVDIVQSMLLDGERPFGYRASNRTITLPILIAAPDQVTLTAAREILMQVIDQQTWTLIWTPAVTLLPLVFDCFRALPTTVTYGFMHNQMPYSVYTIQFQAMPYGRSDPSALQQVPFSSPLLGGVAAPPSPVVLDAFSSVSGTNWSSSATKFVVGPHSAHYTPPNGNYPPPVVSYTKTFSSTSITGLTTLSVWFGQSYDTAHFGPWAAMISNVTLSWTLTDASAHTLSFHTTFNKARWSNNAANPAWTRITAQIPQTSATFLYGSVTGYKVTISNWTGQGSTGLIRINAWMDSITANPPSLAIPASQRGVVYSIMGAAGTARTPVSCQFQLPQSGSVVQELSGSGLWWPPPGVTSVKAECVGAGGAGGNRTTAGLGGGGGGGEYAAEATLTVAAGTPVAYNCGTGGQPGATQQVVLFSQVGTGNWVCPVGVTTVKAEVIGGGAGGAPGGGGGGGGEYAAEASLAVTAGKTYPFVVGAGGLGNLYGPGSTRAGVSSTFAGDSVTATGHGGTSPTTGGTTGGLGGTGSTNTTHHTGGAGGTAPAGGGGGGGGSGGSAATGNAGSNGSGNTGGAGGAAVTGGGAGCAGANNPGWPGNVSTPGGGGGGGFSSGGNGGAQSGGAGQVQLTYTIAAGNQVSGSSTTFGPASGTTVTANGGASVAVNTATGGAGGTGSANGTHHNGGAGFTATSGGGGGGGSGGSAVAGTAATSSTGAAAVTGGGKGASGGGANAGGTSASLPGGGGGGADMSSIAQTGGLGGAGNIVLTWTPPLAPFGTLIAHRPSVTAPDSLNPCVPVGNTADQPANIPYTVPSLISGVNALFGGTYSIVLINYNWDNPTVVRQVSVTVTQFEYVGGPSYPTVLTRAITPSTDVVNGVCLMGELSLPVKDIDPSNTSAYFTVSILDTDLLDQFLDILFLDSQGETVLINIPPGNTYVNFFVDEPTTDRDLGRVMGSDLDRSQAISVLDSAICSGGPFYINPGDNTFLVYSPQGAPNLGVSYLARWFTDRLS